MSESYQTIGQSVLRVDALGKLTGKALYAGDYAFPGMLHLKVVRSNRPHARILAIHTERAEALPGVVALFTHKDIPGRNRVGTRTKDQPVLCDEKVRLVGDPVVLIAGETLEVAEEAASLVRVDYEDLPGVFSPEEALAPGAVKIHEEGNLLFDRTLVKGDPDQGLENSDVVITNTYRTMMAEHAYLEPEAGVANFEDGKVTVWMPSKHSHFDQRELVNVLGLPSEKVRVINTTIGGCFGDKISLSPGYYAALASLKTGRPAKMVYTREESFAASTKRHPFVIHHTLGATRDGRLLSVKVDVVGDAGAYTSSSGTVLVKALIHAAGPYEIPNVYVRVRAVYTNNPVSGSMRGLGVPQVAFAHESQIDVLAETLHLDPFEIRLKNALKVRSVTATGQQLGSSVGLAETIQRVREEIYKRGVPISSGSRKYCWGIASFLYGIGRPGMPNPGVTRIEANDTGGFTLYAGCEDVGQGSSTVLAQIAAEVLRCSVEKIRLITGDTDQCSDAGVSAASRITYIVGRSVQIAAQNLAELLMETAASLLGEIKEDLSLDEGFFYHHEIPHRRVFVTEVVREIRQRGSIPAGEGVFDPEVVPLDPRTSLGSPMATYAFGTQGALVSVDMASGEVEVLSVVACHDVGKAVNPAGIIGQIEGGITMGLGHALMEEVLVKNGSIQNPYFSEYFVPTAMDVPNVIPMWVECKEPTGPFGAKGIGEPALLPIAPAVLNAISTATGVRPKEIPLTPEKLWKLIKGERA
jgi:CO/xanthine dehydrogenase Mo-binding subunit